MDYSMNNFPWGEKEQAEFQKEAEEFSEKYDNKLSEIKDEREIAVKEIKKRLFDSVKRFLTLILVVMLILSLISPLFSSIF
tara:strand:- start:3649 stop:3891 length:243 start_codon:yes stop_codon:yes gene_type:complete